MQGVREVGLSLSLKQLSLRSSCALSGRCFVSFLSCPTNRCGLYAVILHILFFFAEISNVHVLKDDNYLVMKPSGVIPVFLKDKTLIVSLGLIEGLHISVSSLSLSSPFPSHFSLLCLFSLL